jgi:hypothetical protein
MRRQTELPRHVAGPASAQDWATFSGMVGMGQWLLVNIFWVLEDPAGEVSAAAAAWWTFGVAALALIATTVTAMLAWRASHSLAQVERDRWHRELTPVVKVILSRWAPGSDLVRMRLRLEGPIGLDELDSVEVSIRDTPGDRVSELAGSPTADEVARVIWGPLRFRPGVDKADDIGRVVPGRPLTVGEELVFLLEPSLPPKWISSPSPAAWEQIYGADYRHVLRIAIRCRKDGYKPWHIAVEQEFE